MFPQTRSFPLKTGKKKKKKNTNTQEKTRTTRQCQIDQKLTQTDDIVQLAQIKLKITNVTPQTHTDSIVSVKYSQWLASGRECKVAFEKQL